MNEGRQCVWVEEEGRRGREGEACKWEGDECRKLEEGLEVGEKCDAVAFILLLEHANKETQENKPVIDEWRENSEALIHIENERKTDTYEQLRLMGRLKQVRRRQAGEENTNSTSNWRSSTQHGKQMQGCFFCPTNLTPLAFSLTFSLFFFLDYRATLFSFSGRCVFTNKDHLSQK